MNEYHSHRLLSEEMLLSFNWVCTVYNLNILLVLIVVSDLHNLPLGIKTYDADWNKKQGVLTKLIKLNDLLTTLTRFQ